MMGCLEELHHFGEKEVNDVINDFHQEFDASKLASDETINSTTDLMKAQFEKTDLEKMENRLSRMERSVLFVLDLLKQNLSFGSMKDDLNKR